MKGKPKPFLRNSEIDELCERLIYEYMGDDGAGKPVDIIGFTTGFLKLTILYAMTSQARKSVLRSSAAPLRILASAALPTSTIHIPQLMLIPERP